MQVVVQSLIIGSRACCRQMQMTSGVGANQRHWQGSIHVGFTRGFTNYTEAWKDG